MCPKATFTRGLRPANRLKELEPGDTYLHRFKSARRDYKTDIWVAVILPQCEIERSGLHRRPKGAKPAVGEWTTPTNERSYPCFLPARNTYRYAPVEELFELPRYRPWNYAAVYGKADARLFQKLINIARKNLGIDFWLKMAQEETIMKGKRGKDMKLIRPTGYETILEKVHIDSESDDESFSDTDGLSRQISHSPGPGDSHGHLERDTTRRIEFSQFGVTSSFPDTGNRLSFPSLPVGPAIRIKQEDSERTTKRTDLQKAQIFSMTVSQSMKHVLMKQEYFEDLLKLSQDLIDVQQRPEAEQLCLFLKSSDFSPRIVHLSDYTATITDIASFKEEDGGKVRPIGDVLNLGRKAQLEGIIDPFDLRRQIKCLGLLYKQAQNFDLAPLKESIVRKLQIAWNSYPGIFQLQPLVEIIYIVDPKVMTVGDPFQNWIVAFITETYDLFQHDCGKKFGKVMNSYPHLRSAFREKRKEAAEKSPKEYERYVDIQALLQSRGIHETY